MKVLIIIGLFFSMQTFGATDPLRYTKKHIYTSHKKLKDEGMGRIPFTKVKIIPAAPSFMDMGFSMIGAKSKESLLLGIQDIGDSAGLIKKGSKKSWNFGKTIYGKGLGLSKKVSKETHSDAKGLLVKSWHAPWQITKYSYMKTKQIGTAISNTSSDIRSSSKESSQEISMSIVDKGKISAFKVRKGSSELGNELVSSSLNFKKSLKKTANKTNMNSKKESKKWKRVILKGGQDAYTKNNSIGVKTYINLSKKGDEFDKGLISEGEKYRKSTSKSADNFYILIEKGAASINKSVVKASLFGFDKSKKNFSESFKFKNLKNSEIKYSKTIFPSFSSGLDRSNKWRREIHNPSVNILKSTVTDVSKDLTEMSLNLSRSYPENFGAIGLFTGTVKSIGYLVKGIAYDSIIKPIGKVGMGLVGVTAANLVVYPSALIINEASSVGMLGGSLLVDGGIALYDSVSPPIIGSGIALASGVGYAVGKTGAILFEGTKYPAWALMKGTAYTGEYANKAVGKISKYSLKTTGRVFQGGTLLMGAGAKALSYPAAFLSEGILNGGGKVLSAVQYAGAYSGSWAIAGSGHSVKGLGVVSEQFITGASFASSRIAKYSVLGTGYGLSYITYLGKPLTYAALPTSGFITGSAIGIAGAGSSAAYYGIGQGAAGVSYLTGSILASTAVVGGTALTTAYTGAAMVYDAGKGMTLATGALTGGGLLLSYGTIAHAGAHVALGVGDVAYSLASLEFPNYVYSLMKKSDEVN